MNINFNDWDQLEELMSRHNEFQTYLMGNNEDGERVLTSINEDFIVCETWQTNGWVRKMYYHKDHTVEEMYDGKWNKEPDADCYDYEPFDLSNVPSVELKNELIKRGYKVK